MEAVAITLFVGFTRLSAEKRLMLRSAFIDNALYGILYVLLAGCIIFVPLLKYNTLFVSGEYNSRVVLILNYAVPVAAGFVVAITILLLTIEAIKAVKFLYYECTGSVLRLKPYKRDKKCQVISYLTKPRCYCCKPGGLWGHPFMSPSCQLARGGKPPCETGS